MGAYILRRLIQAVFTILGVMLITFLLFRVIAGDVAAAFLGPKAPLSQKLDWLHKFGYDKPLFWNTGVAVHQMNVPEGEPLRTLRLSVSDPLRVTIDGAPADLTEGVTVKQWMPPQTAPAGGAPGVPARAARRGQITYEIQPGSNHKFVVETGEAFYETQFFQYIRDTVTFNTRSLENNLELYKIIAARAPYSLALTVPIMALDWALALILATLVAYYHRTWIDHVGVFLTVLGMCIPYLGFIIGAQFLMFKIAPSLAYGIDRPIAILVPVAIGVIAGLGGQVRFYRTVVLDETRRDYVRTALAKGLPLPTVMFKHILKNCMLPILTNLVLAVPFLIMGSLLLESFFGIPGLGDLLLASINKRDEPIISGLTFLTALIYVFGNLATDISYAVFDPRVRLS